MSQMKSTRLMDSMMSVLGSMIQKKLGYFYLRYLCTYLYLLLLKNSFFVCMEDYLLSVKMSTKYNKKVDSETCQTKVWYVIYYGQIQMIDHRDTHLLLEWLAICSAKKQLLNFCIATIFLESLEHTS